MSIKSIDTRPQITEKISNKIEQITLNSVRKILPDSVIVQACRNTGYKYRQRKITPIVTVLHMIMAAIWPEESFNASWEVLWANMASRFEQLQCRSPSRGTVSEARARLPVRLWRSLFDWISNRAQQLSDAFDKWKGHRVVLADGTCVMMSDKRQLFEQFGTNTGFHGKGKYPLGRLVTLCLANTMTVIDYVLGRYDEGESTLLLPMLKRLRKDDILVADRHFAAAHFYAYYASVGLEFLTRAHQCLAISRVKRIKSYSRDDFIGWLNINKNYRRSDPSLPAKIMVRFIRATVSIRGRSRTIWLVTSLLDDKLYPAKEIVELCGRRWRIETLFKAVKIDLGADILRSQSPDGIRREVAARLAALNIVRSIMLEAALQSGVDPLRISFVYALRAILCFSPALAGEPFWKLPGIYLAMLNEIASHLVSERPGRNEPRAIRHEVHHYPRLRTIRAQWRMRNVA